MIDIKFTVTLDGITAVRTHPAAISGTVEQ